MATANRLIRSTTVGLLAGALLLASGCRSKARREPQDVYAGATALRQKGDVAGAVRVSAAAYDSWKGQPDSMWYWRFRLLNAELLLLRSDVRNASPLLAGEPAPGVPDRD